MDNIYKDIVIRRYSNYHTDNCELCGATVINCYQMLHKRPLSVELYAKWLRCSRWENVMVQNTINDITYVYSLMFICEDCATLTKVPIYDYVDGMLNRWLTEGDV